MFFAYSEIDKNPNPKRRGTKLFEISGNQESKFTSNLTDSPQKIHARRVSLPEYTSVMLQNPLSTSYKALSQDDHISDSSEDQDSIENLKQYSPKNSISPAESNGSSQYSINRGILDRVYAVEKQKKLSNELNWQVVENQTRRLKEQVEKEKEKIRLIQDFQKFSEEKVREKELNRIRMQDYRQQLDVQKAIKMDSRVEQRIGSRHEKEFELAVDHTFDSPNVGYFSNNGRYIKNTPQKLNFNPITGILKENPVRKNIFDNTSEYSSWPGSNQKSFHPIANEKSKNLMGYGNIVINNK